jgi:cysteine desulfurase
MSQSPPIYLDYAAATPIDPGVLLAMQPYFSDHFYNPSATYTAARQAREALDAARAQIAHWLGSRANEITFTAGGTEANNLAIHGIMRQYPNANMVLSSIEHESVLAPAHRYLCNEVSVTSAGIVDLIDLEKAIDEQTVLVSIMYANNEIGTIQPLRLIAQKLVAIRKARLSAGNNLPLYFHSDACQAANYLDLHAAGLGVDLLSINGGKIYGPKQSGALFIKAGISLQPLLDGGGQERGLRSGTEHVAGAIGLATALDIAQTERHVESKRLQLLQGLFFDNLKALSGVTINGSRSQRLPNNVHITIADHDNERLLIQLDELGIMAAAGSACSASDDEPSHVLRALGLSNRDAQASLRFTMGRGTTEAAINQTTQCLAQLV